MRRSYQRDSYELNDNLTVQDTPADDATVSLAFPEGGHEAWSCLLGSFLLMFGSFETSVGTIQGYINTHQLSDYSVRDVGWITAVSVFLTLFLGVQVGLVMDRACY